MTNSRPAHLCTSDAEQLAAQLFDEALSAAGYPSKRHFNERIAEAMGYSASGEKHVRELREGDLRLTLPKILQLVVHRPEAGRSLLTRLIAWAMPEDERRPVLLAVQELLVCTLDLARLIAEVAADGAVDGEESARLDAAIAKTRKAMDRVVSALARPEARPS